MAPYLLELSIPWAPTSLNKTLRSHFRKRQKSNLEWDSYIWAETRGKLPEKPLEFASICLVRHSHRTLDYDGLVGSMKPVVDALVSAKVLKDDSWAVLGRWHVDQVFRQKKDGQMIVITVKEIPV